jgi:hypothetical protein
LAPCERRGRNISGLLLRVLSCCGSSACRTFESSNVRRGAPCCALATSDRPAHDKFFPLQSLRWRSANAAVSRCQFSPCSSSCTMNKTIKRNLSNRRGAYSPEPTNLTNHNPCRQKSAAQFLEIEQYNGSAKGFHFSQRAPGALHYVLKITPVFACVLPFRLCSACCDCQCLWERHVVVCRRRHQISRSSIF